MSHYLRFADRRDAEEASALLSQRGFMVEVGLGSADSDCLLVVKHTLASWRGNRIPPYDYFQSIATHFDGRYDGWEIASGAEAA